MTLTKSNDASDIIIQVAALLRVLRDKMKNMGFEKAITDVAESIPDTYGRLEHIINLTDQAADRSLSSAEAIQPHMQQLETDSNNLTTRWDEWSAALSDSAVPEQLIFDTHAFLKNVPEQTSFTHDHLVQIMMAQDFHDITGQMLIRMKNVLQDMEYQLLALLLTHTSEPFTAEQATKTNILVQHKIAPDNSASQEQVDDLLDSLGF